MPEESNFFDVKTIAIAVLAIGLIVVSYLNWGGAGLTAKEASESALAFINTEMLQGQSQAAVEGEVLSESGLYKMTIKVDANSFPVYISKDGKFLFPQVVEIKTATSTVNGDEQGNEQVAKSDRPSVKLFVMSYCPYGLQAEKGFLGAYSALKDVVDMGVYFVDYAMHGEKEIDENLRQYCIAQEEPTKIADYLACFVDKGEADVCLTSAAIDQTKLSSCEQSADEQFSISANFADESTWAGGQFPPFNVHKDLNEQYGVQGSPTLVINDVVVSAGRSPEAMKKAICDAFNTAPAACSVELSSATPAAGFGAGVASGSGGAQCGQ